MRTINVNGTATISKQPECFNVAVNVDSKLHKTIAEANATADEAIMKIKAYCASMGILPNEIKLLDFRNQPIYQVVEKEQSHPDNWKTSVKEKVFMGYQTTAKVTFSFDFDLKTAGTIFEEMGRIDNISYQMVYALKNPKQYKMEAIALAVKNATDIANVLAMAAGTKVVAAHEISYGADNSYGRAFRGCAVDEVALMKTSNAIHDLGVQDLEITENVSVVFEIE